MSDTYSFCSQFRRYHQSDVMLRGRSCLKEGWWEGAMEVQAGGQNALIKRYEGVSDKAAKVIHITPACILTILTHTQPTGMASRCENVEQRLVSLMLLKISVACR